MRTASSLLLFVLGGVAITLAIGRKPASAAPHPGTGQEQTATDTNRTNQVSDSQATTKQASVYLPVSVLSWGANGVAVGQSMQADTKAYADNTYSADQKADQDRKAHVDGSRGTSHDTPASPGIDQAESAANDGGHHMRLGSGPYTAGGASNANDTDQKSGPKRSSRARINQSQDATNETRDASVSTGQVIVRASVGCEHPMPRPQTLPVPEAPMVTQTQTNQSLEQLQEALIGRR